jgi:S-DNA-T family DNA segregation ATPase FtsK/SpoIIIE
MTADLLPFPGRRTPDDEAVDEPVDEIHVESAELVVRPDDDTKERIRAARVVEATVVDRPKDRRPVLPGWAIDRQERRETLRWLVAHVAHVVAFHTVRLPKYGLRLAAFAPRGLGRGIAALWRWIFEVDARPLEHQAVVQGDVNAYLTLMQKRGDRTRNRLAVAGGLAGCALVALLVAGSVWGWLPNVALAVAVGVAGWFGRPKDRPLIDHAVGATPTRKLTPDLLVHSFKAAGLCKDTDPITFPAPVCRDGRGWLAVIDLPYGTKASTAVKRREDIAAALDIDEVQVHLSRVRGRDGSARRVVLWVADQDPYAETPPVTPLASMESVDFWKPIPFGLDARTRLVAMLIVWSSLLIASIPRMGKTTAARQVVAGGALDPFVRLIVFDGKGGKDWQPFEQVAHRYGSGVRDAVVVHLRDCLAELVTDMNRRYETLRGLPHDLCPEGRLTPAIARNRTLDMPLVLVAIDEVQRYLEHPELGRAICDLLIELVKVGPAAGIMLVLATQRPDAKTLPEGLRGQVGIRFAMKVMNWQSSDTILGAGAYPELDASKFLRSHKGVGILLGADDNELAEAGGQVVRTYRMDLPSLQTILDRARELRIKAGTLTGVAAGEEPITEQSAPRLLDDVAEVFGAGETRLWSETIVARLAERNPAHYDGWTPTDLANALRPYGISTAQMRGTTPEGEEANRRGVTRDSVVEALAATLDRLDPRNPTVSRLPQRPDGGPR